MIYMKKPNAIYKEKENRSSEMPGQPDVKCAVAHIEHSAAP